MNNKVYSLSQYCEKFNKDFNTYLKSNLVLLKDSWHQQFLLEESDCELLTDSIINYCIDSQIGGKRFRPYLVYLMAQPLSYENSLNYAMAIELLHSFALVHDDIMDKSEIRRGKKSIYKYTEDLLCNKNNFKFDKKLTKEEITHIAYSMAILIGDYLFSLAEGVFEEYQSKDINFILNNHRIARKTFQTLKSEVILGQMLDVELGLKNCPTKAEILQKTFLKTANYSVSRPMQIGLTISNHTKNYDSNLQFCLDFGFHLGLAFQIQDDFLNLTQTQDITGKKRFSDIYEKKQTLANWYLTQECNITNDLSLVTEKELDFILSQNKVYEYLEQEFVINYETAQKLAKDNNFLDLENLVEFLKNRTK